MHWTAVLDHTGSQPDGGARSFPIAAEARFRRDFTYHPPNQAYQALISRQPQPSQATHHSAGWLFPDEAELCHPVLVAPSLLSAISFIRQILPLDTLPDDGWQRLVVAGQRLAQVSTDSDSDSSDSSDGAPPSAQKPTSVHSPSPKRTLSLSPHRSAAKRTRTNPSPPSASPPPAPPSPVHVTTTVTSKNRRAERERTHKIAGRRLHNKLTLGLLPPSEKASRREVAAYESIVQQDECDVAWILKQDAGNGEDFMTSALSPYATATSMLEKARAVGNGTTRYHAAAFLSAWRSRGSPFPMATHGNGATQMQMVPWSASTVDEAFCSAYQLVDQYEHRLAAVHIEYRWAMAFLGRAYANKVTSLEEEGSQAKVRTRAIAALLQAVTPTQSKARFKLRLNRAARWYRAAKALGWGCLCLMPDDVNPKWGEQSLRVGEWHIWLELAKKVNGEAHKASQALDAWLGPEGIAGGPISNKEVLYIEASVPFHHTQVEEIRDSDDDEDEGEEEVEAAQRSLLELCKPLSLV